MAAYSQKKLEEIRARNAGRTTGGGVANPRDTANKGALIANPRDNQSFAQKEAARMRSMNVTGGQTDRSALIAEARKQYGDGKVNTYGKEGTGRTGYTEGGKQVGIIGQDVNNQQTFAEKEAERMNAMNVTGQNAASGQQEAAISNATEGVQGGDQPPTMASTAGVPGADQVGVSGYAPESQYAAQSGAYMGLDSSGLPAEFQQPLQVGQAMNEASTILAQQDYQAGEDARRKLLERQLGQTSVVDALSAEGASFADLSMAELEELAASEGVDLSDRVKDRLRQGGLAELEAMEIERNDRLAEIEFTKNQVKREFDRALDDREEFNAQQDVRMRRIMGTFGGGEVSSMAGNIEVMRGLEKGQRALEDLRSTYADNVTQLGRQADSVIKQYTNGVRQVESAMANTLEEAYQGVMGRVDELIAMGVTNKTTLNRAVFEAKKEYVNLYNDVTMKAAQYVQDQNQWLAEQQQAIAKQQFEEDKYMTDTTGMIYKNGAPLTDQNGNAIPTFSAIKEQSAQDAELSKLTGTLYSGGQPVRDQNGNPISTLQARANEFDQWLGTMQFNQGVAEFNAQHDLNLTKNQFDQMKFYAEQQNSAARFAFEQAKEGISVTDSGAMNATFPGDLSASEYSPVVTPGGVFVNAPIKDLGDGTLQLVSGRRQCGAYVNDVFGKRIMGNTIASKVAHVTSSTPTPGSAFVLDNGAYYLENGVKINSGHTGIVEKVNPDGTLTISESNYLGEKKFRRIDTTLEELQARGLVGFTNGMMAPPQPEGAVSYGGYTAVNMNSGNPEDSNVPGSLLTATGKPMTTDQAKAFDFANRMLQSEDIFHEIAPGIESAAKGARNIPLIGGFLGGVTTGRSLPNALQGPEVQQQRQAETSFVLAALRRESGGTVRDDEFPIYEDKYFPMPGDSEEVLARKRASRLQDIKGMLIQAGKDPDAYIQEYAKNKPGYLGMEERGALFEGYSEGLKSAAQQLFPWLK